MIESRRIPNATVSSIQVPSESGPRCKIVSHIEWSTVSVWSLAPDVDRFIQPVMPHILDTGLEGVFAGVAMVELSQKLDRVVRRHRQQRLHIRIAWKFLKPVRTVAIPLIVSCVYRFANRSGR